MNVEEVIELMKFAMSVERENMKEEFEMIKHGYEQRLEMDLYNIEQEINDLKDLITEKENENAS